MGRSFNILLLIYGIILNLNELIFAQQLEKEDESHQKHQQQPTRFKRNEITPSTTLSTSTENSSSSQVIVIVCVGVGLLIAICLVIIGYVVYKKCCKKEKLKSEIPPPVVVVIEQPELPPVTDGLNHPSTFCEVSNMNVDRRGPDVIGKAGEQENE